MNAKENLLRVIRRNQPQWVPNGMENVLTFLPPIIERPSQEGFDAFGVHWSLKDSKIGTYPTIGGHKIKNILNWENEIKIPDISNLNWAQVEEEIKKVDRNEYLVQGFVEMGLFERSWLLLGIEESLISYIKYPEIMYKLLGLIADYKIELIKKFYQIAKIDILWYGDDWGTQTGLFLPPDNWRKIIKPNTKKIYDVAKSLNIIINQHSCGKIEEIFRDMVEIGADIWNPAQPCNNLATLKYNYGDKICFCGGIDSQFVLDNPNITPEDVRNEVRRKIDMLAPGGGYIPAPSHGVPYREEILFAMNDEINKYGKTFYKKMEEKNGRKRN